MELVNEYLLLMMLQEPKYIFKDAKFNDNLTGIIDGRTSTFYLSKTPREGTLKIDLNHGDAQVEYTVLGNRIDFIHPLPAWFTLVVEYMAFVAEEVL
jgi:hypothetical protein